MKYFLLVCCVFFSFCAFGDGWVRVSTAVNFKGFQQVDSSDGSTPETGLTITQADIQISKNGGTFAQTSDSSPTAGHDLDGFYTIPLTATDTNTMGRIQVQVTLSGALSWIWSAMVVPAAVYDSTILGSGFIATNVSEILGVAQSATDLKDLVDNWYDPVADKGSAIALVDVTTNLTNGATGAAGLTAVADSFTLTTGTTAAGDVTSTYNVDGVYHQVSDATGEIEVYYEFDIGPQGQPTLGSWVGRLHESNPVDNTIEIYAYNWGTTAWDQVRSVVGVKTATDSDEAWPLFSQYVGTGANVGLVRIRFYNAALDVGLADLYTDQIFVSYTKDQIGAGYQDSSVWINTNGSNSGTVVGFDGTAFNPVNNLADAYTLTTLTGLMSFRIQQGSALVLDREYTNYTFTGVDYTMDFNGQILDASVVQGAICTGVAVGNGGSLSLISCLFGTVSIPNGAFIRCAFSGPITLSDAGVYNFNDCYSFVPGDASPVFDCGAAVGSQDIGIRDYHGGLDVRNFGATGTDVMSYDCTAGQLTLNPNCESGGSLRRAGLHRLKDNSGDTGTAVNVTQGYGMTILTDASEYLSGITGTKNILDDLDDASVSGIWSELQVGYTTAGTFGYFLDAKVSDAAGGGIGTVVWEHTVTSLSQPVADALLEYFTDAEGVNFVTSQRTNNFGVATVSIQPGTYWGRVTKSGHPDNNPFMIVVTP